MQELALAEGTGDKAGVAVASKRISDLDKEIAALEAKARDAAKS
jgi:hypothetical protein